MLGAWGVVPFAALAFAFVAARLGAILYGSEGAKLSSQAPAGVLAALALAVLTVRLLALVHLANSAAIVGAFGVAAVACWAFGRANRLAWPRWRWDPVAGPVVIVAALALAVACVAARWLPVWQWDALGYHLPFVHFVLAGRSTDAVPPSIEYVGTYPHDVELFIVGLRACLPDDRLIDLAQLPFGIAGAVATGAIARRFGSTRGAAVAAGAAWMLVPAVFLQLPTDYVDVATASFLLLAVVFILESPASRTGVALAGLAVGLFAGSKPSAPLPAAFLFVLLTVRAARERLLAPLALGAALLFLFGAESYLTNIVRYGNPVWPVAVDLGPLHLPGTHSMHETLSAGAAAPHLTGALPCRMVRSFFALTAPPVFDMRIGGMGPVVVLALPFAVATLWRRRDPLAWALLGATLLSPDPAVARYVLAFPAFLLAAASPLVTRLSSKGRTAVGALAGALGLVELVYAIPGLTGDGPPLVAYARMTDDERALAVGADGPPTAIALARRRVGEGEAFAFDRDVDLADLVWDSEQSYRVVFLDDGLTGEALGDRLVRENVRVVAAGDGDVVGAWAAAHPSEYERIATYHPCRRGTCALYARR